MVMGVAEVESATWVVWAAVVRGAESHKTVLQGVVSPAVPVVVSHHILLAGKPLK